MTVHTTPPDELHEPPVPIPRVLLVGLTGVGLAVTALILGLATGAPRQGFDTHWADGPRALLACLGLLLAGCAVSMRPGWYGGWLCLAAAGLIGYGAGGPAPDGKEWYVAPPRDWFAGVPVSWDSIQLFFGVLGCVGLLGALMTRLSRKVVLMMALVGVAYHFVGIMSAITSPPPTPWLTDQYWRRVSSPYLQFAYMNNAYQFYSPDPGPACELWVCFEYAPSTTEPPPADAEVPRKECDWVYLPRRSTHYVDPLGLTFYRHLSVTENLAQYQRGSTYFPVESDPNSGLIARRRAAEDERIPRVGYSEVQRIVPNDVVTRQLLPSYARHMVKTYGRPGRDVTGVKIYRTTHTIITLPQFHGYDANMNQKVAGMSPYNPMLYMPYYQGEFDKDGNLLDPTAPLLYWLIPIRQDRAMPESLDEYRKNGFDYYFSDYVSRHAGCNRPKE